MTDMERANALAQELVTEMGFTEEHKHLAIYRVFRAMKEAGIEAERERPKNVQTYPYVLRGIGPDFQCVSPHRSGWFTT
jgi:hypothetical protein